MCADRSDAGAAAGRHQLLIGARGSFCCHKLKQWLRCADQQLLLTSPDPVTPDRRVTGKMEFEPFAVLSPHTWMSRGLFWLAEAAVSASTLHRVHINRIEVLSYFSCPRGMFPESDLFQRMKRKWEG